MPATPEQIEEEYFRINKKLNEGNLSYEESGLLLSAQQALWLGNASPQAHAVLLIRFTLIYLNLALFQVK